MQNGDITISMDQAMLQRNDYTDDYLHSRANAMQVKLLTFRILKAKITWGSDNLVSWFLQTPLSKNNRFKTGQSNF